ncbi:threonine aspartase 1 [Diabrotica virgifera virgifera]|uniref:Threonine aspartase 1 n=1 Tax=Diabrotica virgifera virgifera TaxID=50390 RepID=A0A6P7FN66_DIAVI|nr:threonine aspartase 1 [Diabrotica virgifera virgifera]
MVGVVAVHCGAGSHSKSLCVDYKKLCNRACNKAIEVLAADGTALEAAKVAVMVLEDDPLTNCGFGSNLNTSGIVENDASIMDGKTLSFGGCGCIKKVKNPITLAYDICIKQSEPRPMGLIPPSLLVGQGGLDHARQAGLKIVKQSDLISKKALKQFNKYKKILDGFEAHEQLLDTVGAICIDGGGNVASACSSGGLLLKKPGRVGQGALFGCGTWADSSDHSKEPALAVCTSGCGEHLVQTLLAREIALDLKTSTCPTIDLHKTMTDKFMNSKFLKKVKNKMGGALVLHRDNVTGDVVILWGHSTESMVVGYMGTDDKKPKSFMSVLPQDVRPGEAVNVGGSHFYNMEDSILKFT